MKPSWTTGEQSPDSQDASKTSPSESDFFSSPSSSTFDLDLDISQILQATKPDPTESSHFATGTLDSLCESHFEIGREEYLRRRQQLISSTTSSLSSTTTSSSSNVSLPQTSYSFSLTSFMSSNSSSSSSSSSSSTYSSPIPLSPLTVNNNNTSSSISIITSSSIVPTQSLFSPPPYPTATVSSLSSSSSFGFNQTSVSDLSPPIPNLYPSLMTQQQQPIQTSQTTSFFSTTIGSSLSSSSVSAPVESKNIKSEGKSEVYVVIPKKIQRILSNPAESVCSESQLTFLLHDIRSILKDRETCNVAIDVIKIILAHNLSKSVFLLFFLFFLRKLDLTLKKNKQ